MKHYLFVDSPNNYTNNNKYYIQGSSPKILYEFLEFIDSKKCIIDTIYLCMYLYNNEVLHDTLVKLSEQGIRVNIISIPLEGYDNSSPQNIYDINKPSTPVLMSQTKYSLAEKVYRKAQDATGNFFKLYVFPHMYIRSPRVRPFSRGRMPYSLHGKSVYMRYKDGSGALGLTSSNLAVRDLIKDEIMALSENDANSNTVAQHFFDSLIENSILITEFDDAKSYYDYEIKLHLQHLPSSFTLFTGPYYEGSQKRAENFLVNLIAGAQKRVYLCAQHICAYNYFYDQVYEKNGPQNSKLLKNTGILSAVLEKSREGISIKCLSQTFVDPDDNSHGCRRPENPKAFRDFIKEYERYNNCLYAANDSVHSKFIIVDNVVVVTTCNFTPTQFIYLGNVNIASFDNIPNLTYKGIHSEVGQFLVIRDEATCEGLIKSFNDIWNHRNTYHHKIQAVPNTEKKCKQCGSLMKKRSGRYGEFWGCTAYPECSYTENT